MLFGFADDDFGEEGGRAVARMMQLNSSTTCLWLLGMLMICTCVVWWGSDDFRALLHVTRFEGNGIGPEGARAIGSALERNSTLTSLNVGRESARCSGSR